MGSPVDFGVVSLKQGSTELSRLNNDPGEGAMRERYLFASVSYRHSNLLGHWEHDGDTAVDGWSARGDGLGALIHRHSARLVYQGGVAVTPGAPHREGMNPRWFGPVIEFLRGEGGLGL